MSDYHPPFILNSTILKQVAKISEMLGRLSFEAESAQLLRLRRVNWVIASPREILEVENAVQTYNRLEQRRLDGVKFHRFNIACGYNISTHLYKTLAHGGANYA